MATEYGFIYILGNDSMPGIYKIGFTLGHPKARMDQLSSATACPTPFYIVACFGTAAPREGEMEIHREWRHCRINDSREFFKLNLVDIQEIVRCYGSFTEDLVCIGSLDFDVRHEERRLEREWKRTYFFEQDCDPIHWPARREGFR